MVPWTVYVLACFQKGVLWWQAHVIFSSSFFDVAASLLPVVAAPVRLSCRDLLHSALASGQLCQVRAACHCSFLDSVLELLTGSLPKLGSKKQGVVKFVMDAWLAPAGLRDGQILEARTRTSPPATLSSPLPPLIPRVENFVMDSAALPQIFRVQLTMVASAILRIFLVFCPLLSQPFPLRDGSFSLWDGSIVFSLAVFLVAASVSRESSGCSSPTGSSSFVTTL